MCFRMYTQIHNHWSYISKSQIGTFMFWKTVYLTFPRVGLCMHHWQERLRVQERRELWRIFNNSLQVWPVLAYNISAHELHILCSQLFLEKQGIRKYFPPHHVQTSQEHTMSTDSHLHPLLIQLVDFLWDRLPCCTPLTWSTDTFSSWLSSLEQSKRNFMIQQHCIKLHIWINVNRKQKFVQKRPKGGHISNDHKFFWIFALL